MIAKILVVAAFLVLLMYVVLPRRAPRPAWPAAAPRQGRRAFAVLCVAAVLLLVMAVLCAAFWMGTLAGGEAGDTTLLRVAAVLFTSAAACALAAFLKRP